MSGPRRQEPCWGPSASASSCQASRSLGGGMSIMIQKLTSKDWLTWWQIPPPLHCDASSATDSPSRSRTWADRPTLRCSVIVNAIHPNTLITYLRGKDPQVCGGILGWTRTPKGRHCSSPRTRLEGWTESLLWPGSKSKKMEGGEV